MDSDIKNFLVYLIIDDMYDSGFDNLDKYLTEAGKNANRQKLSKKPQVIPNTNYKLSRTAIQSTKPK